jgi:hypothetical protein
MALNYN